MRVNAKGQIKEQCQGKIGKTNEFKFLYEKWLALVTLLCPRQTVHVLAEVTLNVLLAIVDSLND